MFMRAKSVHLLDLVDGYTNLLFARGKTVCHVFAPISATLSPSASGRLEQVVPSGLWCLLLSRRRDKDVKRW